MLFNDGCYPIPINKSAFYKKNLFEQLVAFIATTCTPFRVSLDIISKFYFFLKISACVYHPPIFSECSTALLSVL